MRGAACWVEGIGERLQAMDFPEPWYVAVFPHVHLDTRKMFSERDLSRDCAPIVAHDFTLAQTRNVFEPIARQHAGVERAWQWLSQFSRVQLTGSGSGLFASCESRDQAEIIAADCPAEFAAFVAKGMNRSPCIRYAGIIEYSCAPEYLGRRQVVRHRVLIPAFAGSNPAGPANALFAQARRYTNMIRERELPVDNSLMVFSGNAHPTLSQNIVDYLNIPLGKALISRFSDGEVQVEIQENVRGKDVFIVQPTSMPTNDHIMELLIIVDALRRASAERITTVIPYFGYSRQDRRVRSIRVPISAKVVANLLSSVGANRVLTVDLHADQIQGFFDIPVDNVYASPVLLGDIYKRKHPNLIVVSPMWAAWCVPGPWPSAWMTPTWPSLTSAGPVPTRPRSCTSSERWKARIAVSSTIW